MSYLGIGVSPGDVPVHHGNNMKKIDKRVKIAELILRCIILGLAVVGALLIGSDSEVKVIFSIKKEAKFTDMKVLVFLVIANGLAAAYSLIQVLRCIFSMIRGSVLFNKPLAWAIFSGDQCWYDHTFVIVSTLNSAILVLAPAFALLFLLTCILCAIIFLFSQEAGGSCPNRSSRILLASHSMLMAYLVLSAVAAAAQSGVISKLGQPQLQWMKVCNLYGKFCNQVGEGIASSLLVSLSMIVLSGISAFSLFRLYGNNRGKSNAR
ncbi:CASP-like protein 2B1 [Capsicum annuum]|nr:CASP-like protein 2B1 [Capsicum annuum]